MNGMALWRTGKDTNGGGIVLCRYGFGKHRNEREQGMRIAGRWNRREVCAGRRVSIEQKG